MPDNKIKDYLDIMDITTLTWAKNNLGITMLCIGHNGHIYNRFVSFHEIMDSLGEF